MCKIGLILILISLILCACGNPSNTRAVVDVESKRTTVVSEVTEESALGESIDYSAYEEKIREYSETANLSSDEFFEMHSNYECGSINNHMLGYYHTYGGMCIAYAYYDIDKNGRSELLFSDLRNIIDVYALEGSTIVKLFENCDFGDRTNLYISPAGELVVDGSSGASSGGLDVYSFDTDGFTLKPVFKCYYDENGESEYMGEEYLYVTIENYGQLLQNWTAGSEEVFNAIKWTPFASSPEIEWF